MRRRGFTLIEVLVTMALAAMLLLLLARVFQAATSTQQRVQNISTDLAALRRTYEVLSRDMHSAVVAPDDSGLQFGTSSTAGTAGGIGANVLQLASVVGEPLLVGRQASDTVLVQYAVADDPRTGKPTLWRYETAYPVPNGSQPGTSQDTKQQALLPGVVGANYTFYSTDQQQWLDSWDGQTGLPAAIRVDLALQGKPDSKEPARQESWTFALPASRYANDEAQRAADSTGTSTSGASTTPSGSGTPTSR